MEVESDGDGDKREVGGSERVRERLMEGWR